MKKLERGDDKGTICKYWECIIGKSEQRGEILKSVMIV